MNGTSQDDAAKKNGTSSNSTGSANGTKSGAEGTGMSNSTVGTWKENEASVLGLNLALVGFLGTAIALF